MRLKDGSSPTTTVRNRLPGTGGKAVTNWGGDLVSWPRVVVSAGSAENISAIMRDPESYPAPVRAVGSNHSTTRCGIADNGTLIVMRGMDRILDIDAQNGTVTAEAGALYIDVAKELEKRGLQFYVNVELGNLTIGSGATGGTKDASMPGEFGQVAGYATRIKMVTPTGEIVEITESEPDLLQAARSSYGLFGVVVEVTFRVRPLHAMKVYHEAYHVDEFCERLPELIARDESMMLYIMPFKNRMVVEYRKYQPSIRPNRRSRWRWRLRNTVWKTLAPGYSYFCTKYIPVKRIRYLLTDMVNPLVQLSLERVVRQVDSIATDQMIRYPEKGGRSKYTFSIWCFPQDRYTEVLRDYIRFVKDYYRDTGYRCDLLNVGYRVSADQQSLFSYSFDGDVLTVDPVSTGSAGWDAFLVAYNEFCSERGGIPLFNQTKALARHQVEQAFGPRLQTFNRYRADFDPDDRLLNSYFRELLA